MHKLKVHWLLNSYSPTMLLNEVRESSLASVRLRAGAFSSCLDSSIDASFGREVINDASIIIVGRIGSENIDRRASDWLSMIRRARDERKQVIIDYTDHHAGVSSVMSAFYIEALNLATQVVVPSRAMHRLIAPFFAGRTSIIEDALEVPVLAPKAGAPSSIRGSRQKNLLWFGHATNIPFLLKWLSTLDVPGFDLRLQILTSEQAVNSLRTSKLFSPSKVTVIAGVWSLPAMISAASTADVCVIPCGVTDRSKMGASSNRLLTALALGLPVAADLLDSYVDYKAYFSELRGAEFLDLLEYPPGYHGAVLAAQKTVVPLHSVDKIGRRWRRFFLGIDL